MNVPDVDGVPAVNFAPGSGGDIILATADAASVLSYALGLGPQWGIFRGGAPVVVADSVTAVDFKAEWAISDYPLENGAFESYDKVKVPYDTRVVLASGGSLANRKALLDSVAAIAGDLQRYAVVTPEAVYPSVNIVHYDYRRTAQNGVGLLQVAVWLQEVRISVGRMVTGGTSGSGQGEGGDAAAAPSGAGQENGGTVQPQEPGTVTGTSFGNGYSVGGFNVDNPASGAPPSGSFSSLPIDGTTVGLTPGGPGTALGDTMGGGGNAEDGTIPLDQIDVPPP